MYPHSAVVHFATVPVPLPSDADRVTAALGHTGFVHRADRIRMRVLLGHQLLATVPQSLFIPLDRFQEPL